MIILGAATCFSQTVSSGIYIIYEPPKKGKCAQELKMLIGKRKVCVSKKPILGTEEIEYITAILYDPKHKLHYVNIGISSTSVVILNKVFQALPKSQFALVLDDKVLCFFIVEKEITIRTIRVGEGVSLKTLTTVHNELKKIQPIKPH